MPPESGLSVKKPIAVWNKPLKTNFKEFFKALGKAGVDGATGQWIGLGKDAVDALAAIGLDSNEPAELVWTLIYNALTKAIADLMAASEFLIRYVDQNINELANTLDLSLENSELEITDRFFEHPAQLPLLQEIQIPLKQWFEGFGLTSFQAETLSARLPTYFVFALNHEWRQRPQDYGRMATQVNTPFTQAAEREQGWRLYNSWLQKQIQEPMMFEAFGLEDIYIPLRAYFKRKKAGKDSDENFTTTGASDHSDKLERVVVDLKTELERWVRAADNKDAIRVISGGPGSGKSSFAKIFADHQAHHGSFPVLFIPLHQFDPTGDLVKAVGEFVRYDEYLKENPIDPDDQTLRLLVIFDGLDELAMQGKLAKEVAQGFGKDSGGSVSFRDQ
ncbi:hypothetical protein [Leptothoe sp. PORK10 BA2]|uniref:hypothetical protein n=1 Tax=Leptothoe sp. PORK10 BA2 TaxID=3110254 RepID=UPI002B220442|nr:hypothetical protein [Leptothoe sp. PORK10 BA2]MEA5465791.1 hypothetical protein [Leptothoe sp. PORK10 BA2]